MAEESGAPLKIEVPATVPDPELAASLAPEIEAQQRVLDAERAEAARFSGGLVHALKLSAAATQEQSLSMLRQRYLIARYGLHVPPAAAAAPPQVSNAPAAPDQLAAAAVLKVRLQRARL
jgi:hypothetical protein